MRTLLAVEFINALISCRGGDEGEEHLKWSCADMNHSSGYDAASPHCYNQLKKENDPVLTYFSAIPQLKGGKN